MKIMESDIKLIYKDIEEVACILGGDYFGISEKSQSINYDGYISISNILEAADFIRSKIEIETPIEQSH